jgi:predicted Zn-dependent protease
MANINYVPIFLTALITIILFTPVLISGYASEIKLSDCGCKWYKSELIIWIDNRSGEIEYTNVAIDAINEWQDNFKKISYEIHTLPPGEYDIVITIHKTYGNAVGLPKETVGFATNEKKPNSDELIHATIDVSTSYRNAYGSISKIKDAVFYNMVLHEFGHAIGLGHAVDNGKNPLDPMHHALYIDEDRRKVSELDVITLDNLYG